MVFQVAVNLEIVDGAARTKWWREKREEVVNEDLDSAVDEAVKDTRFGPDRYNAILRYFNGWGSSHDGKRGPSPRVTPKAYVLSPWRYSPNAMRAGQVRSPSGMLATPSQVSQAQRLTSVLNHHT